MSDQQLSSVHCIANVQYENRHHKITTKINKLILNRWPLKRCTWKHVLCCMKCNTYNSRRTIIFHDSQTSPIISYTTETCSNCVNNAACEENYVYVNLKEVSIILSKSARAKKWTHRNSSSKQSFLFFSVCFSSSCQLNICTDITSSHYLGHTN